MLFKSPQAEPGMNDWVMSYADMITILMAFFVVMYSLAGSKDNRRERAVFEVLREQFGPLGGWGGNSVGHEGGAAGELPLAMTLQEREHEERTRKSASLLPLPAGEGRGEGKSKATSRKLSDTTTSRLHGGADTRRVPPGLQQRVHAQWPGEPTRVGGIIEFAPGQVNLDEQQKQALSIIAEELAGKPQKIEVRGHSGGASDQTKNAGQDGWDLSYARAHATMQYLESHAIDPRRIRLGVAAQYEIQPPADAQVADTRRPRVEVFLLNEFAPREQAAVEPATNSQQTLPDSREF